MAVLRRSYSHGAKLTHFLRCSIFCLVRESYAYQEQADSAAQLLEKEMPIVNGEFVGDPQPLEERNTPQGSKEPGKFEASVSRVPLSTGPNPAPRLGEKPFDQRDDAFAEYQKLAEAAGKGDDFDLDKDRIAAMIKANSRHCAKLEEMVVGRAETKANREAKLEEIEQKKQKALEDQAKAKQEYVNSASGPVSAGFFSWYHGKTASQPKEVGDAEAATKAVNVQARMNQKADRHPGYHAMEIVEKLHPCLNEISNLGKELNAWIKSSQRANDDLKTSFGRIFKTVHTLKESKLERMFRQQHERVWKTLINRALQIQTVLEALYNPMLPGKGFYLEDEPYHAVMVDPERVEHHINKMTMNDLSPIQKRFKWLYNKNKALSSKENPEYGS